MAQTSRAKSRSRDRDAADMEMLVDEQKPRNITEKNSGTRSSSLPPTFCEHIGLKGGSAIQVSLNPGQPIIVDEPCIIIRPHPEASEE